MMGRTITNTNTIASSSTPTKTGPVTPKEVELDPKAPGFREPGQIPTNYELATGAERYEYLKLLRGEDPWEDMQPIVITGKGTPQNPIVVSGVDPERYVGCTGRNEAD